MSSIEIESLQNACFSGDKWTVKNILSQNNFNNYLASSSGYSLLCSMLRNEAEHAMYEQHLPNFLEITKLLLQHPVKVNDETQDHDQTPLHFAVEMRNVEIVKILLAKGAIVNARNQKLNTPLHIASQIRHKEISLLLLQAGADVNATTDTDDTPLHSAAKYISDDDNGEFLKMLINNGANLTAKNIDGLIPLNYAVYRLSLNSATVLLGENPNTCDMTLKVAFCLSFLRSYYQRIYNLRIYREHSYKRISKLICELFYNHGFRLNIEDIKNMPISEKLSSVFLDESTKEEYRNIVQSLFNIEETSCDEKMRQEFLEYHVLIGAIKYGAIDIFYNFLPNVCNVNTCLIDGYTLLHHACEGGRLTIINELLARGANVNCINSENHSLLYYASVFNRDMNITKLLLHYGATCLPGEMEAMFDYFRSKSEYHKIFDLACDHNVNLILDRNYPKCPNELEEMKKSKISETAVTMYDLLTMSHRRLSILMRNNDFLDFINSFDFKTSFPNFARRFKVRVNKAKLEKRLIELSYDCFRILVKFQLPILVLNEIISYMDTADLHRFVIASSIKSEMKKTVQFYCSE